MKIPRIVLDTNVLVSALLKPWSDSGVILGHVRSERLLLLLDPRMLMEYREVLRRPKFMFSESDVDDILAYLDVFGEDVTVRQGEACSVSDPDDLPFLEVAVSGHADALITGNKKDFGRRPKWLRIVSPSEFLKEIL